MLLLVLQKLVHFQKHIPNIPSLKRLVGNKIGAFKKKKFQPYLMNSKGVFEG